MNESPDDAVSMKGQKLMRVFKIRKIVENQNGRRLTLRGSLRVFSKNIIEKIEIWSDLKPIDLYMITRILQIDN